MRLESFCKISMRYVEASWHRPYGSEEALGFGHGDGTVSGELEGTVAWANYPRRREDGVWTPNLRGVITTSGGAEVLVSMHGQSVEELSPGHSEPSWRGSSSPRRPNYTTEHRFPGRRRRDRRGP
jgi:hypothetical protein